MFLRDTVPHTGVGGYRIQIGKWDSKLFPLPHPRSPSTTGLAKIRSLGLVNFVTAVAYHYCLVLPAAFTQPGDHLLAQPCTLTNLVRWPSRCRGRCSRNLKRRGGRVEYKMRSLPFTSSLFQILSLLLKEISLYGY